jgi:hypothetical protein
VGYLTIHESYVPAGKSQRFVSFRIRVGVRFRVKEVRVFSFQSLHASVLLSNSFFVNVNVGETAFMLKLQADLPVHVVS